MKTFFKFILLVGTLLFLASCTDNTSEFDNQLEYEGIYVTVDNTIHVDNVSYEAWDYESNTPIPNQFVSIWMNEDRGLLQFTTDAFVTDIIINGERYTYTRTVDNNYTVEMYNLDVYNQYRGFIRFQLNYLN